MDFVLQSQLSSAQEQSKRIGEHEIRLATINERLKRLMDALLDGHVDTDLFTERKKTLLSERLECEAEIRELRANPEQLDGRLIEIVELAKAASLLFEKVEPHEKRQIIRMAMSNCSIEHKTLDFVLKPALSALALATADQCGDPLLKRSRTFWERFADAYDEADAA